MHSNRGGGGIRKSSTGRTVYIISISLIVIIHHGAELFEVELEIQSTNC